MLKAALNRAFHADRVSSDSAWRKVKPFKKVDEAVVRYLSVAEARRLVGACPEDFRKMVQAALLTGCRYSELARLKCGDFNADSGTLAIRLSKGKIRHVVLTDEGKAAFADWTAERALPINVFLRADGERLGHLAPEAAAGRGQRPGRNHAGGEFPHPAPYPRLASRHERRADGRHRRPARPRRHPHDRKALRPSGAELCRADDPGEFSNT